MARRYGWADVAGVIGHFFAPVSDAVRAETGRTVGEVAASARRAAAGVLGRLAEAVGSVSPVRLVVEDITPAPAVPDPQPVPVPVVSITPVAVAAPAQCEPAAVPPAPGRRSRPAVTPDAVTVKPRRAKRSALAALVAERVPEGVPVFVRKGTRYVRCADPTAWNPSAGPLFTRHGSGRQTRYTELIPERTPGRSR